MTKQKVESFDVAIRDAKSMFQDFIFYLRKKVGISDEIARALTTEVSRWEECGQERCSVELFINWQELGLKALERDYDGRLDRVVRSSILTNFFKNARGTQKEIESVQLSVRNFEWHNNTDRMFSELKESSKVIICQDKDAVPAWLSDHWFAKASEALFPTLENLTFCKKGMVFLKSFRRSCDPETPIKGDFNIVSAKERKFDETEVTNA